jgi:vacuolar protein sorting-associated protein 41
MREHDPSQLDDSEAISVPSSEVSPSNDELSAPGEDLDRNNEVQESHRPSSNSNSHSRHSSKSAGGDVGSNAEAPATKTDIYGLDQSAEERISIHDSDNETDSNESESEAESEIEEPRLKYSRITSLPTSLFSKDALATCLFTDSLFVFATHSGTLHLTKPDFTPIRSVRAHRASILSLSTDGHYLASASMDGTVVVGSLSDEKEITASDFHRPLNGVALDPNYKVSKTFISGGMAGNVVYSERNWLGRRIDTNLYEGEDPIVAIHWIGNLIIWMSDQGITVCSALSKSILLRIPRDESSPRADLYTPRISTPETNLVYISWANEIWALRAVSSKKPTSGALFPSAASIRSLPVDDSVEVTAHLKLEWYISGIAPYDHDTIMLLCFPINSNERHPQPELKLIDREFGEELYADELSLKEYEKLGVNDYHLGYHALTGRYLLLSARDSILAVKRNLDDRLGWLQERELYREAWALAEKLLEPTERFNIGLKHLDQLIESDKWSNAGYFLSQLLSPQTGLPLEILKEEWHKWGWIFIKSKHVDCLSDNLSSDPELGLNHELYDNVILDCLEHDRQKLGELLNKWNVNLFSSNMIKNQLEDELSDDPTQLDLEQVVAKLYLATGEPSQAVGHLLRLSDPSVIDVIAKFHLLPFVEKDIGDVLTVGIRDGIDAAPIEIVRDKTRLAIIMVVDGRHELVPERVVKVLNQHSPRLDIVNFLYLEELNEKDPFAAQGFADLQLKLSAEFDRPKLLGFLKRNNYNLSMAVQLCEKLDYVQELVYLLGKVGQNGRALRLIIERLGDPAQAIEFAKEQNDKDLWNDLLDYSMDKPLFIKELLIQSSTGAIDPLIIIKRMPSGMQISQLKDIMIKLFIDKEVSLSLIHATFSIIENEARALSNELRGFRLRGDAIDFENEHPDLDLMKPVIVMPTGEFKTENELLGDEGVWKGTFRTFGDKIHHLYYIISKLL